MATIEGGEWTLNEQWETEDTVALEAKLVELFNHPAKYDYTEIARQLGKSTTYVNRHIAGLRARGVVLVREKPQGKTAHGKNDAIIIANFGPRYGVIEKAGN